jgi:hypothetical protein
MTDILFFLARWAITVGCMGVAVVAIYCTGRDVIRELRDRRGGKGWQ